MSQTPFARLVADPTSGSATGLALLLKRTEHVIRQRFQPVLDAEELLVEHWQILEVLLDQPGIRMSDLAQAAVVPAATLTRHMDRLVTRALVVRRVDAGDKRRVVAALSPRGQTLTLRLRSEEQAIETELAAELGQGRYEAVVADLLRACRLVPPRGLS